MRHSERLLFEEEISTVIRYKRHEIMQHLLNKHFMIREGTAAKEAESHKLSLGSFKMPSLKTLMKETHKF